jgi:hypothetical protein
MKKFLFSFVLLVLCIAALAQDTTAVNAEEATGLRANEKIYVVAAVLATVLAGLFIYVIRLDRKITKMERNDK